MGHRGSHRPLVPPSPSLSLAPATELFRSNARERGVETVDIVPDVSDRVENQSSRESIAPRPPSDNSHLGKMCSSGEKGNVEQT